MSKTSLELHKRLALCSKELRIALRQTPELVVKPQWLFITLSPWRSTHQISLSVKRYIRDNPAATDPVS